MSEKMSSENFKLLFYKLCSIKLCNGLKDYKLQFNLLNDSLGYGITMTEKKQWELALKIPEIGNENICPIGNISELKEELGHDQIMRLDDYDNDWKDYQILFKKKRDRRMVHSSLYILDIVNDSYVIKEHTDGYIKNVKNGIYSFRVKDFFNFQIPKIQKIE